MVTFSKLTLDEQGNPVETDVREIPQESIALCPHYILVAEHYYEDGLCRCYDVKHTKMKEWGYTWNGSMWV